MTTKVDPMAIKRRRFVWRTSAALGCFGLVYFMGKGLVPNPTPTAGTVLILVTTAPLIYWAYEYQLFVRKLDELQSLLSLQSIAIGAGGALLTGALWGVAEAFIAVPDLNPALLLPLGALLNSIALFFLARRYK